MTDYPTDLRLTDSPAYLALKARCEEHALPEVHREDLTVHDRTSLADDPQAFVAVLRVTGTTLIRDRHHLWQAQDAADTLERAPDSGVMFGYLSGALERLNARTVEAFVTRNLPPQYLLGGDERLLTVTAFPGQEATLLAYDAASLARNRGLLVLADDLERSAFWDGRAYFALQGALHAAVQRARADASATVAV